MAVSNYNARFIDLPGNVIAKNPLQYKNVLSLHFVFRGDQGALQENADNWLSYSVGKKRNFEVQSPIVMLTYLNASCGVNGCIKEDWSAGCRERNCARMNIVDDKGNELGVVKHNALFFSYGVRGINGKPYYFSPYSFTDSGYALANYREQEGYKMTLAEFIYDKKKGKEFSDPSFPLLCRARLLRNEFIPFHAEPWSNITRIDAAGKVNLAEEAWETIGQAKAGVRANLLMALKDHRQEDLTSQVGEVSEEILKSLSRISLRQFRGLPGGVQAMFKSIVTFRPYLMEFQSAGVLNGDFSLAFPDQDPVILKKFPIQNDMGLEEGQKAIAAFWVRKSFVPIPEELLFHVDEGQTIIR